jgi:hypothetical protein
MFYRVYVEVGKDKNLTKAIESSFESGTPIAGKRLKLVRVYRVTIS